MNTSGEYLVSRLLQNESILRYGEAAASLEPGYSIIATAPVLALVRVLKIAEDSTDYSLQNTIRHTLWLPTTRIAKKHRKRTV